MPQPFLAKTGMPATIAISYLKGFFDSPAKTTAAKSQLSLCRSGFLLR
jgi:hypothetical protein